MNTVSDLFDRPRSELLKAAAGLGLELPPHLSQDELVAAIVTAMTTTDEPVMIEGALAILPEGFGFVRLAAAGYAETAVDAYVSPSQIRGLRLLRGHRVRGPVRAPRGEEQYFALTKVESVGGRSLQELADVTPFEARTAVDSGRAIGLGEEDRFAEIAERAPWRFGHRVLIHTTPDRPASGWLRRVGLALAVANPAVDVTLCLLDQPPEELAAAKLDGRAPNVTVAGAEFATPPKRQANLADLALHAAMRQVEQGKDAVLVLDSLTSLTRAYARSQPPSGAWIQPGVDAHAVLAAMRLFAAARDTLEGGSLTVVAAIDEGSSAFEQAIASEFTPRSNCDVWPHQPERSRTRPASPQ